MLMTSLVLYFGMICFCIKAKVLSLINRETTKSEYVFIKVDKYLTDWSKEHSKSPRILYIDNLDCGFGIEAEALPATNIGLINMVLCLR